MKTGTGSFSDLFFSVRKQLLITFYVISVIVIGFFIIVLVGDVTAISPPLQLFIALIVGILGMIGGAFLSVLLDLPMIGHDFDEIKNDIAKKKIKSPEEFGARLVKLLCNYFTFSFFSIDYALVKIQRSNYIYSASKIQDVLSESDYDRMVQLSKENQDVTYFGEYEIENRPYHLYLIPIVFGDEWLGFIGIFTPQKLWRIFQQFLSDFENIYVDDQLVHVLATQKQIIQKQFYREIDVFSNKITKQVYTSVNQYLAEILQFLVNYTNCTGGLGASIYQEDCVTLFTKEVDEDSIKKYYFQNFRNHGVHNRPRIISDPNVPFKAVFEIPISIDRLQGIVILFDNTDTEFLYFFSTVVEIENIKMDNDLDNLAIQLGYHPLHNAFILP